MSNLPKANKKSQRLHIINNQTTHFRKQTTSLKQMEFSDFPLLFTVSTGAALVLILILRIPKIRKNGGNKRRPPGPPGWPLLGNMFDLGPMPHHTMHTLKAKYGPVLWLRMGSVNTMVVQSAAAASDLFRNHDLAFSDRKLKHASTAHDNHLASLAGGNYGAYWRELRKICSSELLVNRRINETAPLRQRCVDKMIHYIAAESGKGTGEVAVAHFMFLMMFNLLGNLMLSKDLVDSGSKEGYEFFNAMNRIMELNGTPNVSDFFPLLKWADPQGLKRDMVRDMGQAIKIVAGLMKERIQEQDIGREKINKDFLQVLLEYESEGKEGPAKFSEKNITLIIQEMFLAGTETTSSTIEWAMAELLRHPECMEKAKEELRRVVGTNKKVEEGDMDSLPYLQAVVKETLRLHPPLPFLIPRNATQDTNYMGYSIPKDTEVLVNVWAIGRDPDSWEEPLSFMPERFLESNIDYKGQHFELIPFGSGRRICVGLALAHRLLHHALASLLQNFDWELGSNLTPETIDMNERMGITLRKHQPLKAIPKKCFV